MAQEVAQKKVCSKQPRQNPPGDTADLLHLRLCAGDEAGVSTLISDKLLLKILSILEEERVHILDAYYEAYCEHISKIDKKRRSTDELKLICTPVKHRFTHILERFMGVLRSRNGEYDLMESEQDEEYALRFVVPGRYKKLDSHYIIEMTHYFYDIVTSCVLKKLNLEEYSISGERVANLMHGLVYITFEDLWVSSVVAFRSQHSLIQQLLCKLMMTQEEERQNLWREIHDELLQVLGVVGIKLEIVERLSQIDRVAMKRELNLIKTITKKTIQEIREFGHGFNLFWVERKGFVFSLKRFVKVFEQEFRIPITLGLCPGVKTIDKFPAVTLFRVIQEGLYNVGKHSGASQARVDISVFDKEVVATIEDNGTGFDVNQVKRKSAKLRHLGLVFMHERTKILGGSLEIESQKGRGSRIKVSVPIRAFSNMSGNDKQVTDAVGGKQK